jgi:hypothetical protein
MESAWWRLKRGSLGGAGVAVCVGRHCKPKWMNSERIAAGGIE